MFAGSSLLQLEEIKKLHEGNIRLRIVGAIDGFSQRLQKKIREAETMTAENTGMVLNIAANYGGRWEIAQATKKIAEKIESGELTSADITESTISENLPLNDMTDIDLLIRTGGDHRVSNFLLWQIAYAELYFTPVLWPDFNEEAFLEAIASFVSRERRFGCTGEQIKSWLNQSSETNQ